MSRRYIELIKKKIELGINLDDFIDMIISASLLVFLQLFCKVNIIQTVF